MADDLAAKLGKIDLFSGFSSRALRRLAQGGKEVDHPAGRAVAVEGKGSLAFHLVLEGTADVDIAGSHRRELHAGDYFGEISLLDGRPRSATVRAGDHGLRTFALSAFEFQKMLDAHPDAMRSLLVALCGRLRSVEAQN
jgi:CRP/FNR family transcriptional regulator, cyclic AMP receptor protein